MAYIKNLVLGCLITFLGACAVDDGTTGDANTGGGSGDITCEPGETQDCACPGDPDGTQACKADGSGWGVCDCPDVVDTTCDIGETKACACDNGRNGSQSCNASQSGWNDCVCTGPIPGVGGTSGTGGNTPTGGNVSTGGTGNVATGGTDVVDNDLDDDGWENDHDCNDGNASINPAATETCNGIDDDCDGSVDEGLTCGSTDTDIDNDDYTGSAFGGNDCDDNDANVHPGATEVCEDGVDNDCAGGDASCGTSDDLELVTIEFALPNPLQPGEGLKFAGQPSQDTAFHPWEFMCDSGSPGSTQVSGNVYTCTAWMEPGWRDRPFNMEIQRNDAPNQYAVYEDMGMVLLYGTMKIMGEVMTLAHAVPNDLTVGGRNFIPNRA